MAGDPGLHPALELLEDDVAADSVDLVLAARELEGRCDWDRLRWLTVEGSFRPR